MKVLLIISVGIFGCCAAGFAQISAAIYAHRTNSLFVGLPNPLTVTVCGLRCEEIVLVSDNGPVLREEGCDFLINPVERKPVTIKVLRVKSKDTTVIYEQFFPIAAFPLPTAELPGMRNGKISVRNLLHYGKISAPLLNYDISLRFSIKSYTLMIIRQSGSWREFHSENGPEFTPEMNAAFGTLVSGDRLIVSKIMVDLPAAPNKELAPVFLSVD